MKQARILIAEDDPAAQNIIGKSIQRNGNKVIMAEDGAQCLHFYRKYSPDLMLIDFQMPLLDGLEVLEKVRQEKSRTELPIIMITAKGQSNLVSRAVSMGINDFITKPIKVGDLVDRISRHIFHVEENFLREILGKVHIPDISSLSQSVQASLQKKNMTAFPVDYKGLKLCLIMNIGKNPHVLANKSRDELEKDITVLAKPGFIWNTVWPNVHSNGTGETSMESFMNEVSEWKEFIS